MTRIRRLVSCAIIFALGWGAASLTGGPREVLADVVRPSLASLQAAIDSIISGSTVVGHAAYANYADGALTVPWSGITNIPAQVLSPDADNAQTLDGFHATDFATHAELAALGATIPAAGQVPAGATAPSSPQPGTLFFHTPTETLYVFTGSSWISLN